MDDILKHIPYSKLWRNAVVVAFAFMLFSCGINTRTIMEGNGSGAEALLLDIHKRGVYSSKPSKSDRVIICAEPSPDAFSTSGGKLDLGKIGKFNPSLGIATTAAYVGLRTQTIQILRDAMYRLCEAQLNGQISGDEYYRLFQDFMINMETLLAVEQLTGAVRAPSVIISSQPSTDEEGKPANQKIGENVVNITFGEKTAEHIAKAVTDIVRLGVQQKSGYRVTQAVRSSRLINKVLASIPECWRPNLLNNMLTFRKAKAIKDEDKNVFITKLLLSFEEYQRFLESTITQKRLGVSCSKKILPSYFLRQLSEVNLVLSQELKKEIMSKGIVSQYIGDKYIESENFALEEIRKKFLRKSDEEIKDAVL